MEDVVPHLTWIEIIFLQYLGLYKKLFLDRLDERSFEQNIALADDAGISKYQVYKKNKGLILWRLCCRVIFPILALAIIITLVHPHGTGKLDGSNTSSLNSGGTLDHTVPSKVEPTEATTTFLNNYDEDDNKLKNNFGKQQEDYTQADVLFFPIESTSTTAVTTLTTRPEAVVPENIVNTSESPNYLSSSTPQSSRDCSKYNISYFDDPFRDGYPKDCNSKRVPPQSHQGVELISVTCTQCDFMEAIIGRYKHLGLVHDTLMKPDAAILEGCHAGKEEPALVQLNNLNLPNLKHLWIDNAQLKLCTELIEAVSTWRANISTLVLKRGAILSDKIFQRFFKNFAPSVQALSLIYTVFCSNCDPFQQTMFPKLERIYIIENQVPTLPRTKTVTIHQIISLISRAPKLREFYYGGPLTFEDINNILNNISSNIEKATFNIQLSTATLDLFLFSKFPKLNNLMLIVSLEDSILGPVSVTGFGPFAQKDFHMIIESQKTFQLLVDSFYFKEFPGMLKILPTNQTLTWKSTGNAHLA